MRTHLLAGSVICLLVVASVAGATRFLAWNDPKAKIPADAKETQCIGSAARRVCVGGLEQFEAACLQEMLDREKTSRDEIVALQRLKAACTGKGALAGLTVGEFGGQAGSRDYLNLITLHSAKGLEFEVVIMMGLEQGRIPRWYARTDAGKREDRRLFYVGLTRAKHEVHMSYSGWTMNRYGRRFNNGPSEFLQEVKQRIRSA